MGEGNFHLKLHRDLPMEPSGGDALSQHIPPYNPDRLCVSSSQDTWVKANFEGMASQ